MGAREDLLSAAQSLTRRGLSPFSPAQLIAEARANSSRYPDSTLRTHIVSLMCVDSPNHHGTQYEDLHRVARGQYRLHENAGAPPRNTPVRRAASVSRERTSEPPPADDATTDWRWEGNVQAAVVRHLAGAGWSIRRVADTASRERGVDIEASRDGEYLLVEVKGYPSSTYVRGPKEGQAKTTGAPLQARTYFAGAILSGMLLRNQYADAHVALAFPDVETYRSLAGRTAQPLRAAGLSVWLVEEDGTIAESPTLDADATAAPPRRSRSAEGADS